MSPQFIRGKLVRHLSKLKSPQNVWMDNISCHDFSKYYVKRLIYRHLICFEHFSFNAVTLYLKTKLIVLHQI
jgi:hypothetical protein